MIDFHTHILHGIDDGSRSVNESLELLALLKAQGVTKVFATPHFLIEKNSPTDFFEKRNSAFRELSESITEKSVEISLGAEVAYFQGMSRMREIFDMRLSGTDLLLVEMPYERWSDYTVRELKELACYGNLRPVIAHVERCLFLQPSSIRRELLDMGIIMQSNASFFINPKTSRKAIKHLKHGEIHVLSSDCHSVDLRPPKLSAAVSVIRDKCGEAFVKSMNDFAMRIVTKEK